jgi:hypothetical protein
MTRFVPSGLLSQSIDSPVLKGNGRGVYDRPFGRWLPADQSAVSPDGTSYAYVEPLGVGDNELHVVDVRTGDDRVVSSRSDYAPLAYQSDALYLVERSMGMWNGSGIFVIDPRTNEIHQIHSSTRTEFWMDVIGNFAYGADINPSDPNPVGGGEAPDELIRLDLRSDTVARFQYHPGQIASPVAVTASGQLIAGLPGLADYQLIDAAGNATGIPETPFHAWQFFVDPQRTWLLAGDLPSNFPGPPRAASIYLLYDGRYIHEMDFQWDQRDHLAGACI